MLGQKAHSYAIGRTHIAETDVNCSHVGRDVLIRDDGPAQVAHFRAD